MNDQEVMTLVKRLHDYSCYNSILTVLLILFLIITICSAFLLEFLQYEESSEEDTKVDRIIAFISMLSVMFFAFGLLAQKHLKKTIHYQQMVLAKKVITNKSETWMDWKQDEKGNYHFDNSGHNIPTANKDIVVKSKNVKKYDLSPTAGSVPIAEVTTRTIKPDFKRMQKEQIRKALPEHSLDSSAEVDE